MYVRTDSLEDTNVFMGWIKSVLAVRKIKKILRNKQSHANQIKAIKKVLS